MMPKSEFISGFFRAIVPIVVALLLGSVVILISGDNPLNVYFLLLRESAGGWNQIQSTLTSSTVLLFTATATAIAFRAGIFSLAAEGSLIAGGFAAAVVGASLTLSSPFVAIPIVLLASMIAGLVAAAIPAALRAWLGVDEVVSTLLFTFIIAGVVTWLVQTRFQAPGQANSATLYVADVATLPRDILGSGIGGGFLLGLLCVGTYGIWVKRSSSGFAVRMLGTAPRYAKAIGVRAPIYIFSVMAMTGVVAGLGGGVHLTGLVGRYVEGFSAGYGFTGLAIAILARMNPWGIIAGAIFFGAITSAGGTVQLFSDIPLDIVNVLQGLIMLTVVVDYSVLKRKRRRSRGDSTISTPGGAT